MRGNASGHVGGFSSTDHLEDQLSCQPSSKPINHGPPLGEVSARSIQVFLKPMIGTTEGVGMRPIIYPLRFTRSSLTDSPRGVASFNFLLSGFPELKRLEANK